ncbi:MAG: methyl-accepting chemotaxis protein [Draconibacterium sp.]|nr:methyl-accepting chemotaxis protein [Draconibacterium sp.]
MNFISRTIGKSLSAKVILASLAVSLIPLTIISVISFLSASSSLKELEFTHLETIGFSKSEQIKEYFESQYEPLEVLTQSVEVSNANTLLIEYLQNGGVLNSGNFNIESARYEQIYTEVNPFFTHFINTFNFDNLFLVSPEKGYIMYSAHQDADLGTSLLNGKYKNTELAHLWKNIIRDGNTRLTDYSIYEPTGKPEAFMGKPVLDENGETVAVLIVEISSEDVNRIMTDNHGFGETGETFLVGEDYYLRSDSRFETESTILTRKIETESVKLALDEASGVHIIDDYRGKEALSYHTRIKFSNHFETDFKWVLIAEIEKSEALAPAYYLERELLIIGLLIGILVAISAMLISRYFTRPTIELTKFAEAATKGDFSKKMTDIKRNDETGTLIRALSIVQTIMEEKAQQAMQISEGNLTINIEPLSDKDVMGKAFKIMVESLNEQMGKINEFVSILTSSNSQLMSTIAELSSASSETATTVSEITTTIEEVKQTAELAAQKAKNVATSAQKSVNYSENGIKATEDSIEGMNQIQSQVKQIADTIIKLSEQSQTIGEITGSVNDLAEQSNLLAVNASIEAVKAGDYGKGFGVVAQEIRALSDQSKQATNQIRNILNDVQKAISSAVMATEQGSKAVDKGMGLTEASGSSISMLADSISEATMASTQIAASSQQQLTGMEQLTAAMENIKQAANQNASGAKQAEEAVSSIKNIVVDLQSLTGKYQTK